MVARMVMGAWFYLILRAVAGALIAGAVLLAAPALAKPHDAKSHEKADRNSFRAFVAGLWPEAEAHGVSRKTFGRAFSGVTFDPKIIALTKRQAELLKPIWDYIAGAVTAERIERGREKLEAYGPWLAKARCDYGVDPAIIIGIWGLETDFGG